MSISNKNFRDLEQDEFIECFLKTRQETVKTLKIFGVTNEKKFSRPGFSKTIQIKDYGFKNLKDFPLNIYENILQEFLKSIDAN